MALRAILFDFDGVLVNSEPLHLKGFQEVLAAEGILLTKEDYFEKYLGLDDRGCFEMVYKDHQKNLSTETLNQLIEKKNALLLAMIETNHPFLPGVREMIPRLFQQYFLTIVSGALRNEILSLIQAAKLDPYFKFIVGADDVKRGKPDPEGYEMAMTILNRDHVLESEILLPQECLVIEDSPWGITAGKKAGARCAGLTTSYGPSHLQDAEWVFDDFQAIDWKQIAQDFEDPI